MRFFLSVLLVLWSLGPEPKRASLTTVKRWNAATAASLKQQLVRPIFDNGRFYMAQRLPAFDSVAGPPEMDYRLSFLQHLERTLPHVFAQQVVVVESSSEGEVNVLRNGVVTQENGKARVTFFRYRYGWVNEGSRVFSAAEAQHLLRLPRCYERGKNDSELIITVFPAVGNAIQSDYFVERSICPANGILKVFEQGTGELDFGR